MRLGRGGLGGQLPRRLEQVLEVLFDDAAGIAADFGRAGSDGPDAFDQFSVHAKGYNPTGRLRVGGISLDCRYR